MNDDSIAACIEYAKKVRLAGADEAATKYAALQEVAMAAREYFQNSDYMPAADGSCRECSCLTSAPEEHAEWCSYRRDAERLDKALANLMRAK